MTFEQQRLFIGGEWVAPHSPERIEAINASTGEPLGSVPHADRDDTDRAVAAARAAFDDPTGWSSWEPTQRADAMRSLSVQLAQRSEDIAQAVSQQNGMPITIARQLEGGFPLAVLDYFTTLLNSFEFEVSRPHLLGGTTTVRREPLGVVGAIAPWNYPQTLAMFKLAPALAAGCTVVLKPSPETVLDSIVLAQAIEASDLPAGVINIVPGGREVGAYLVEHPSIDKVAFTGSTAAGRKVAVACANLIRPVTLELGGKSAAIVLEDAELDLATIGENLFGAMLLNNGQTCFASTRILAPASRFAQIEETMAAFVTSLKVGSAAQEDTLIGPMASQAHRERVEGYIARGKADGGRVVVGGGRPDAGDGWFVEPTLFSDISNTDTIAREEIFGPVLALIKYDDVEDAIRLANDSEYGLGGSVWTADEERGFQVARRVRTGTIGINRYLPDPGAPFGGVKSSGIGRELGPEAMFPYLAAKSIFS